MAPWELPPITSGADCSCTLIAHLGLRRELDSRVPSLIQPSHTTVRSVATRMRSSTTP